jgi:hypothetical protein
MLIKPLRKVAVTVPFSLIHLTLLVTLHMIIHMIV